MADDHCPLCHTGTLYVTGADWISWWCTCDTCHTRMRYNDEMAFDWNLNRELASVSGKSGKIHPPKLTKGGPGGRLRFWRHDYRRP